MNATATRTLYSETLLHAADIAGGLDPLAHRLGIGSEKLQDWLMAIEEPPLDAFISALDIITDRAT